jgi:tetratricopeptide (TPR) repeat protein
LLTRFPDDQRLLAWRLQLLRENGRAEDRLALLTRAVRLEQAHPLFTKELASELGVDIRHHREVGRLLWKAHRMMPLDASVLTALAQWQLRTRRDEGSLDFHRFAASLVDKDENFARNWFTAASAFGRSGDALAWLRRRFEAYGDRSGAPAVTLGECLDHLQRTDEALAVLSAGIARRPEDGELLVQAARLGCASDCSTGRGHLDRPAAAAHLGSGVALLPDSSGGGQPLAALKAWQECWRSAPSHGRHRAIHEQLACLEGEAAALQSLAEACARFPHHYGLNEFHVFQLRKRGPEHAEPAARRLVETHPTDPRARRMLAGFLGEMHRLEEALGFARSSCDMAPDEAASHGIHGKVLAALGRREGGGGAAGGDSPGRQLPLGLGDSGGPDVLDRRAADRTGAGARRDGPPGRPGVCPPGLPSPGVPDLRATRAGQPATGNLAEAPRSLGGMEHSRLAGARRRKQGRGGAGGGRCGQPLSTLPGAWRDLATLQRILGNDERHCAPSAARSI